MKHATEIAERLIACAVPGGMSPTAIVESCKSFGVGEGGISIPRANAEAYVQAMQQFFAADASIPQSYTFEKFQNAAIAFISPYVLNHGAADAAAVRAFFAQMQATPILRYDVLRPIFGLHVSAAAEPVVLGPYTIYDTAAHSARFDIDIGARLKPLFASEIHPYMIQVAVRARDPDKAVELADALFERFESTLRFLVGHASKRFEVGVVNYWGPRQQRSLVRSEQGAISDSSRLDGSIEPIPIDDPFFVNSTTGFDRIWACLASESTTELERRLLLAVEWIGQSLSERVPASAFLKAAIALEILFTHQEKTLINASILSQIAEHVALLLASDVASRLALEKEVKRLYRMRSSIAHAGKSDVDPADVHLIRTAARHVVIKLLTAPSLGTLTKIADLYDHFKTLRFGGPAI